MGVLVLTGCDNPANMALSVGNESVSDTQIQDSVHAVLVDRQNEKVDNSSNSLATGSALTNQVLQVYLGWLVITQVAKDLNVSQTPAGYINYKTGFINSIGGTSILPATLAQHNIAQKDFELIAQRAYAVSLLNEKAKALNLTNTNGEAISNWINTWLTSHKVKINPKYGQWDSQNFSIQNPVGSDGVEPAKN